jgi:hypothetical protein
MTGTVQTTSNFSYTSGTTNLTGLTITFRGNNSIIPGNITYGNVIFAGSAQTQNLNSGTMIVVGTLGLSDGTTSSGNVNSGTIEAYGPFSATNYGKRGSALIRIVGTNNQIASGAATAFIPSIEIAKTGGTLSLTGTLNLVSNYTYTSGTIDAGTSVLDFTSASTIVPGNQNYYDVKFRGLNTNHNLSGGTMNVTGTLTFADSNSSPGSVNSGTLMLSGNLVASTYGKLGTVAITFTGGAAQTTSLGGSSKLPTGGITVNKSANDVTQLTYFTMTGAGALTLTSGNWSMAGFALTTPAGMTLGGNTLTKGGGVLTVGGTVVGTGSLYGGTVAP